MSEVLEKQLRQKLFLLENGVARIAHTRNQLKDNADLVRREIRACFGHQLCCLRSREQQLLSTLDTVLTVKDELLSEQQDQLHQAFGACRQGLECMAVAREDVMKKQKHNQASMEAVELNVQDILNKLSSVEIKARETSQIAFEADTMSLRRTLHSFGHISTCKTMKEVFQTCESLPGDLEDYDEEPTLLHKPLQRQFHFGSMRHNTGMSCDRNSSSWLMKEALSGPTSNDMDSSGLMRRGEQRHNVTHWLHHIKTQVETEPVVFEDFEIARQKYGSELGDSIVSDREYHDSTARTFDPSSLFSAYFAKILNSPTEKWILNEKDCEPMLRPACTSETNMSKTMVSGQFKTDLGLPANHKEATPLREESDTPVWLQVFAKVKESNNDLWLSSEYVSLGGSESEGEDDIERVSSVYEGSLISAESIAANFRNLGMGMEEEEEPSGTPMCFLDKEKWLAMEEVVGEIRGMMTGPQETQTHVPLTQIPPMNQKGSHMESYESVLGWQAVLEKVHGGGDEMWLSTS